MCEQYQSGVTLAGLARSHAEWDERHAACHRRREAVDLDRDPERPLRLGFVSPDLRRHPVGFFLARVLENLDRRVPAMCLLSQPGRSATTCPTGSRRRRTSGTTSLGLDDDALAEQIRADRIDILFDLSGHTGDHRLLVFARRPAPIQITWIGYVGTTGLAAMDYLIADRFHVPPGAEAHYREKVLRMPDGYVCFDPPAEAPAVGPLPALERGHVTFGSFNNRRQAHARGDRALGRDRAPRARVAAVARVAGPGRRDRRGSGSATRSSRPAAIGGSSSSAARMPRPDLLAAYNTIDLALDPFPYSGGVTTCEALWMGVPVVTCPGETFASRHSLSHLSNVGLTETVAADPREYVELAVRLAGDLPHLAALRAGLRDRMARSPLCDGDGSRAIS